MIEVQLLIIIWPVGPCGQSRRKPWWKLTSVIMTSSQIFSRPARINSVYKYILFILIPWQNLNANHRANDLVTLEGLDQVLTARFMYGPLDMVSLSGEKVMNSSWWSQYTLWLVLSTHVTSRHVTSRCAMSRHATVLKLTPHFGQSVVKLTLFATCALALSCS